MALPTEQRVMGWIEEICAQGIRRPGYDADRWSETWAAEHFERLGLRDVRLEEVQVPRWTSPSARLTVGDRTFNGFALPHTEAGVMEATLVIGTEGSSGAIAVVELTPSVLPQSFMTSIATSSFDPDGDFEHEEQTLPFGPLVNGVADPAVEAGAVGFVGLLTGFGWETCDYYVPYDATHRPIIGLWLSKRDGAELLELVASGATSGRIEVDATEEQVASHNVIGVLPGSSDEWVVIASHHDAPWASAVEDASGIALVLAQAEHWAAVPEADRPHNLLFLLTAGHMCHAAGTRGFLVDHADLLDSIVLEVHLEHVARRCESDGARLLPTDLPEPRWWFTSTNPRLESSVQQAIEAHDLRRSLVLRPDIFFPEPPTDGAFFHSHGVPLVQLLASPSYLFDAADTIDKIHGPSIEPIGRAVVSIITSTAGVTAEAMRAGVVKPTE